MSDERLRGDLERTISLASKLALDVAERDSLIEQYKVEIGRLRSLAAAPPRMPSEEEVARAIHAFWYDGSVVDAARAVLALFGRGPAPEWRPISSAPRDGTFIVCYAGNGSKAVTQCRWGYNGYESGWLNANGSLFGATHWRPLPAPPEQEPPR